MSEERTLILKLGQMITDRIGHKVTVDDPEYWGLTESADGMRWRKSAWR